MPLSGSAAASGRPGGKGKGGSPRRRSASTPDWRMPALAPEINWQLGVAGHLQGDFVTVSCRAFARRLWQIRRILECTDSRDVLLWEGVRFPRKSRTDLMGSWLSDSCVAQQVLTSVSMVSPPFQDSAAGNDGLGGGVDSMRQRHFWRLLGHLYAKARGVLTSMGDHLGVPLASPKVCSL